MLATNRDGSRLLTCSWDQTAKLWESSNGSLIKTLVAEQGVYDCDLAPDGRLAALGVGNALEVWDTDSGNRLFRCEGAAGTIVDVTFSPDGTAVAAASQDSNVYVWSAETGARVAAFNGHAVGVNCVAFSPDASLLASGDGRGQVVLWDLAAQRAVTTYSAADEAINRLAFNPDGSRLVAGSGHLTVINPACPEIWTRFAPQDDSIYNFSFDPSGRRLATCTTGGSIVICDAGPRVVGDSAGEPAGSR
jgi:WD40 repeat protein